MKATCAASLSLGLALSCCLAPGCTRYLPLRSRCRAAPQTEGPRDRAASDNTSPRVSVTARLQRGVEMLGARPPPMQRPGIILQHVGLFMLMHGLVCKCFGVYYGRRRGGARDAGTCGFYKTDSGFSVCVFSNPLMFAPSGCDRVKLEKGALH